MPNLNFAEAFEIMAKGGFIYSIRKGGIWHIMKPVLEKV
jgi:hypothetical protein